jgi:UDP-glucose 4-epimerase
MPRVLVTGAAGFIGFALAEKLSRQADTKVCLVDNFVRGERDAAYLELCSRPGVSAFDLDLTDRQAIEALPPDVDVIFHMAALNGTQNFYERPYEVIRCSTLPTFHLLDRYGTGAGLKRFVYAGSSEAYAGTVTAFGWPVPTAENVPLCIADPTNVRWSYGAAKLHGEVMLTAAGQECGLAHTIIRYHNVYGPRMGDKHVIPDFLERMKQGVYALYGYEDTRSFLYIGDAVRATIELAECPQAANQTVNVGSDQELRILDLGQKLMELAGVDAEITLHESPPGSVSRRAPDVTRLKALIGFREEWTLLDGLRETMDYYLQREAGSRSTSGSAGTS